MDILPKRKQLRLKYYDYSQQGLYFVTICCQNHMCQFGTIVNGEIELKKAGVMISMWYKKIGTKFPNVTCQNYVVMPNHFHCVFEIAETTVGHTGPTLPNVLQWFKTMTTNDYIKNVKSNNWQRFDKRLWQRSYHEHVILNEQSHQKIVDYIQYNPQKWAEDKYYKPS